MSDAKKIAVELRLTPGIVELLDGLASTCGTNRGVAISALLRAYASLMGVLGLADLETMRELLVASTDATASVNVEIDELIYIALLRERLIVQVDVASWFNAALRFVINVCREDAAAFGEWRPPASF